MNPKLRSNISKVAVITVAFMFISWFLVYYNYSLLYSSWSKGPAEQFSLWWFLFANTLIGFIAGIFGGSALVFVNSTYFRKRSFGFALLSTFIAFSVVFLFVSVIMPSVMVIVSLDETIDFSSALGKAYGDTVTEVLIANYILWLVITLNTQFILQINDKFGPGILFKFITGKYHQPREEQRIFMFMDMKSSTTIAEKLGNKKYFNMLQEVIGDITDDIILNRGEIYQYVGDEVVISWSIKNGTYMANFVNCFMDVQKKLKDLAPVYMDKYGLSPEFKAGIHCGMVTAGEIGSIKKDIVYSGDVLNTASRIQNQCNTHGVNLLMSEQSLNLVKSELKYETLYLGEIELKGKEEKLSLVSLK